MTINLLFCVVLGSSPISKMLSVHTVELNWILTGDIGCTEHIC